MSRDPAVEAAQRVMDALFNTGHVAQAMSDMIENAARSGAREALAPIRDLIEKWSEPTAVMTYGDGAPMSHHHSADELTEAMRELVYSSEEL